jgi:hypothetical protein
MGSSWCTYMGSNRQGHRQTTTQAAATPSPQISSEGGHAHTNNNTSQGLKAGCSMQAGWGSRPTREEQACALSVHQEDMGGNAKRRPVWLFNSRSAHPAVDAHTGHARFRGTVAAAQLQALIGLKPSHQRAATYLPTQKWLSSPASQPALLSSICLMLLYWYSTGLLYRHVQAKQQCCSACADCCTTCTNHPRCCW